MLTFGGVTREVIEIGANSLILNEFSIDRVVELEDDLEDMEVKVERLAGRNERLVKELELLKRQEPTRNRVAV